MSILRLDKVTREIGTLVILDAVDAAIAVGDRIGLVGPNGAGKTTLLRIAAGIDEPDGGSVSRKRGLAIGLLAQEAHLDAAFMAAPDLRTAVRTGAAHLDRMAEELAALERLGRVTARAYADLQHRFEVLGGYTLDQRVDATLSGLGFGRDEWSKPPTALSGGEQTRAALARLVIADPDVLMLDEPTNHLDLDALEWLEEHLRRRLGALIVASHDRAFLDATVARIWELRDRKLAVFRGDYAAYRRQRLERDARLEKDVDHRADAIAREQEVVQRYRSHRKFGKMHEHESRLERLRAERIEAPLVARRLKLGTTAMAGVGPARSGEIAVRIEDAVVGYLPRLRRPFAATGEGEDARLEPTPVDGSAAVDAGGSGSSGGTGAPLEADGAPLEIARIPFLAAQRGERIGIVGPNGAGKTTLLRTIAGELPPLDGMVTIGPGVSLGYLAQLRAAAIPGTTVLEALLGAIPVTPGEARGYLARFLFRGDDVFKEVRTLSGGERSRLELALLGIMPANLLLLDEPTNHLDIPAREAIETFMRETPATLIVVSHDRRMLETICDRLWVVDAGLVTPFDGGYRAWRAAIAEGWTVAGAVEAEARRLRTGGRPVGGTVTVGASAGREARGTAVGAKAVPTSRASEAGQARTSHRTSRAAPTPGSRASTPAHQREKLSKGTYQRGRAAVDAELTRLGLRKNHLELALGDPAVRSNFVELRRITSELADVSAALEAAEEAWLELEERAP